MRLCFTFSEQLKGLIFDKKTTLETLGNDLKIDLSQFYRWQRNSSVPSLDNLIKLSDYFEVTIDFLAGRKEQNYYSNHKESASFGERLQEIISKTGLSYYAFGKKHRVSRSTIRHWIRGESDPLLDSLIKLADSLDVSIDYLVGRE